MEILFRKHGWRPAMGVLSSCLALTACTGVSEAVRGGLSPDGAQETRAQCRADALPDDALQGKTEAEAVTLLSGCTWRIGERDGKALPGTMDYQAQRRTLGIEKGKVVWVRRG